MKWIVEGAEPLVGKVVASGSKNVGLKVIIASLFSNEDVILDNVPRIDNVVSDIDVIKRLGARIEWVGPNRLLVNGITLSTNEVLIEDGCMYRTTALLVAPLLYRFGKAIVPKPDKNINGLRPINRWIETWNSLGFTVEDAGDKLVVTAKTPTNAELKFKILTVMGTENAILSSLFIPGETTILNASSEPEIDDLISFLNLMGANVKRVDERKIVVIGTQSFTGCKFRIMSDRVEVATFAAMAAATYGDITIDGAVSLHLLTFIRKLEQMKASFEFKGDSLRVWRSKGSALESVKIETGPAPGFLTDWQPLIGVLLTQANGVGYIHDTIYVDRLEYTKELNRMGAKISLQRPSDAGFDVSISEDLYDLQSLGEPYTVARIEGPTLLRREKLNVPDLKSGAALLVAALMAEGKSEMHGVENILKGFENLEAKVRSLGAKLTRVD